MQKTMRFVWIGMAAALLAAPCLPQVPEIKLEEPTPAKYFRLDFAVKELEGGKVVNARNYSSSSSTQRGNSASIRAGDKIPIKSGDKGQFTFVDVGVNIDWNGLKQIDNQLAFDINVDISSAVLDGSGNSQDADSSRTPVIHQTKWHSTVIVPFRKPVTIFSSDGASTKRQTQIELTVTPVP